MKVVFFGNHSVGVEALKALAAEVDVVGVVAHPPDPEDGQRYQSVYDFACRSGIPAIRGRPNEEAVQTFLHSLEVELIWVTDYRYLLPEVILGRARLGGLNLHPSLLPKYRGRAPVNWAIINGEEEIGLSAHFIAGGVDDGDIVAQRSFKLAKNEDVGDALDKLMPLYQSLSRDVIRAFVSGNLVAHQQNHSLATLYPGRKPEDGKVDWQQPAVRVRDFVRALASPYPGAFTDIEGGRVYIWKVDENVRESKADMQAGSVASISEASIEVVCNPGIIKVTNFTLSDESKVSLNMQTRFG